MNFSCKYGIVTTDMDPIYISKGDYTVSHGLTRSSCELSSKYDNVHIEHYNRSPDTYYVCNYYDTGVVTRTEPIRIELRDKSAISAIKEIKEYYDSFSYPKLNLNICSDPTRIYELLSALLAHARRIANTDYPPFGPNMIKRALH